MTGDADAKELGGQGHRGVIRVPPHVSQSDGRNRAERKTAKPSVKVPDEGRGETVMSTDESNLAR